MLKDAEGFIWTVWCKVPSFNKSMSQTLLCNNSSCQLFWKISCLSWIPVKQSALILWRKGEQLCYFLLKSKLTSFISLSIVILFHRESLPCAKRSIWTQGTSQLPVQLVCVFVYLFNQSTLIFMKDSEYHRKVVKLGEQFHSYLELIQISTMPRGLVLPSYLCLETGLLEE